MVSQAVFLFKPHVAKKRLLCDKAVAGGELEILWRNLNASQQPSGRLQLFLQRAEHHFNGVCVRLFGPVPQRQNISVRERHSHANYPASNYNSRYSSLSISLRSLKLLPLLYWSAVCFDEAIYIIMSTNYTTNQLAIGCQPCWFVRRERYIF